MTDPVLTGLTVPLELVTLLRSARGLPRDRVEQVVAAALDEVDRVTLATMQAALTNVVVRTVERQAQVVLSDSDLLDRALRAAAEGAPLAPVHVGLDAGTVLAAIGAHIARHTP